MSTDGPSATDRLERAGRVDAVIDDVIARRLASEDVPDQAIIAEHLDLMPELGEKLSVVAQIVQGCAGRCCENPFSHRDLPESIPARAVL